MIMFGGRLRDIDTGFDHRLPRMEVAGLQRHLLPVFALLAISVHQQVMNKGSSGRKDCLCQISEC